jgi:hypothetical protein
MNLIKTTDAAIKYRVDRATVRVKLEQAGVKPVPNTMERGVWYDADEVEAVFNSEDIDEVKLRKLQAEAQLKEHELSIKKGEFASVAEFTELTHQWVGWLYKQTSSRIPAQKVLKQIARSKSEAEAKAILKKHVDEIWQEFRTGHLAILNSDNGK